jgi:hypothetical protein
MNKEDAMIHLGRVLSFFIDIHPDYRCRGFEEALEFYNKNNSEAVIEPSGMCQQKIQYIDGILLELQGDDK